MAEKEIATSQWIDDLTRDLTLDTMRLLLGQSKTVIGEQVFQKLMLSFVSNFVFSAMTRTLNETDENGKISLDRAYKNFSAMKLGLQNAVSSGFQDAMANFSGKDVEYYCMIKMIPEMTSKVHH